jgi:hypothetical protein
MRATSVMAGTRTDKGRGREAPVRGAYMENAPLRAAEPSEPGTRGLALFDEVAP